MTLDIATISIMVALSLGLFGGMLTVLTSLRGVTAEMGQLRSDLRGEMGDLRLEVRDELHAVRLEMRYLREETREELRRFGERLTRHEQSGH